MIPALFMACVPIGPFTPLERERLEELSLADVELPDPDPALAALGRALYSVTAFSVVDGGVEVSCDTCHDLCLEDTCDGPLDGLPGGVDVRPGRVSQGAAGSTKRNSPTVVNSALRTDLGWFSRYCEMTDQIAFPLLDAGAYGSDEATVAAEVREEWSELYAAAFGRRPATRLGRGIAVPHLAERPDPDAEVFADVLLALEAFVQTVIVTDTPFDRMLTDGEPLLPAEVRGAQLFVGKAHCVDCHSGPLLSDGLTHNVGVPDPDLGRANPKIEVCEETTSRDLVADLGKFQTPPLRWVAATGPYLHDGSFETLWEVVEHYNVGGPSEGVGTRDPRTTTPLGLTRDEQDDLVAFLHALGGDRP